MKNRWIIDEFGLRRYLDEFRYWKHECHFWKCNRCARKSCADVLLKNVIWDHCPTRAICLVDRRFVSYTLFMIDVSSHDASTLHRTRIKLYKNTREENRKDTHLSRIYPHIYYVYICYVNFECSVPLYVLMHDEKKKEIVMKRKCIMSVNVELTQRTWCSSLWFSFLFRSYCFYKNKENELDRKFPLEFFMITFMAHVQ